VAEEQAAPNTEAGGENDAVQRKDGEAAKGSGGGGVPKILLIVLVLNVLIVGFVAFALYKVMVKPAAKVSLGDIAASEDGAHGGGHGAAAADGHDAKPAAPEVAVEFFTESFMVNLADSRGANFAKVDVVFEVNDDFVKAEMQKLKPKIRDFITILLSSKTYEQIESSDGRDFLREEIRNKVNGYLPRGQIKDVYFTQFILQ